MKKMRNLVQLSAYAMTVFFVITTFRVSARAARFDVCYFYQQLTERERAVYELLVDASPGEKINLPYAITGQEYLNVKAACYFDYSDFFNLNTRFEKTISGRMITSITVRYSDGLTKEQKQQVLSEERRDDCKATKYETLVMLYNRLRDSVTYGGSSVRGQSAYSALVEGKSVCAGYTHAFQGMCREHGITCLNLFSATSDGDVHAWNVVQLDDGEWYEVDVSQDDVNNSYMRLTTTADMASYHNGNNRLDYGVYAIAYTYGSTLNFNIPVANGTKYQHENLGKKLKKGDVIYINSIEYVITSDGTAIVEKYTGDKKKVKIPESLKTEYGTVLVTGIGKRAFAYDTGITSVTISKNIRTIEKDAFRNCKNLKLIRINSLLVHKIGKNAFRGISSKAVFKYSKSRMQTYKIMISKAGGAA